MEVNKNLTDGTDARDRAKAIARIFQGPGITFDDKNDAWWNGLIDIIIQDELHRTSAGKKESKDFENFGNYLFGATPNESEWRIAADLWRESLAARQAQDNKPCW